jgi:hypothetical protein
MIEATLSDNPSSPARGRPRKRIPKPSGSVPSNASAPDEPSPPAPSPETWIWPPAGTKVCSCCGRLKFLHDFHIDAKAKDGRRSKCRRCLNQQQTEYNRKRTEALYGYTPTPRTAKLTTLQKPAKRSSKKD